ncbi:hypothetical protein BD779DRAFT_1474574 [Infundibulicybe gibba]|nr:hypothetical protein BD779DRAFT_1474574 [Infundibulicybe gibba]
MDLSNNNFEDLYKSDTEDSSDIGKTFNFRATSQTTMKEDLPDGDLDRPTIAVGFKNTRNFKKGFWLARMSPAQKFDSQISVSAGTIRLYNGWGRDYLPTILWFVPVTAMHLGMPD